mgnify:CR=1 FL=1
MKKLFASLVLSASVLITGSAIAASGFNTTPAKITPEFASVINNTVKDQSQLEEYYENGYKAWKFKYSSDLSQEFNNLGGKTANTNGIQSVTTYWDYNMMVEHHPTKYPYQCVGFAKIASNISDTKFGHPTYWTKGEQVLPDNLPPQGTVIATFFDNGTFEGHVGIFVSGNDDRIYMIDQNYKGSGDIRYHAVSFNSGSASKYYVVEH